VTNGCGDYRPIEAYAIIGDCHTAALISQDGSIDWYCPGRFDAPAVFCRLLDARKGGFFHVHPVGRFSVNRQYQGATNVLETVFTTAEGRVRITDFMPVHRRAPGGAGHDVGTSRQIIRLIEGLAGDVEMQVCFKPTFNYCRTKGKLQTVHGAGVVATAGRQCQSLCCPDVNLEAGSDGELRGRFTLGVGERRWVVLTGARNTDCARESLTPRDRMEQLDRTRAYWRDWSNRCAYRGPYRAEVLRSALTLKLLTYEPTGAIVAAPTTSLPEQIGGMRNWDYRFSWLRDASLTLYALMTIGYEGEATDFFGWLQEAHRADPKGYPQIVYTIEGGTRLPETVLDNLEGYECSKPVRVGNGAAKQRQLDIFGEVLMAAHLHFSLVGRSAEGKNGESLTRPGPSPEQWMLLRSLVDKAAAEWKEPDKGLWEVRGPAQQFTYSKLMCWAALDRGIRLARLYSLPAPLGRWCKTRDAIRQAILVHGYNEERKAFTQAFGSRALDASALAIPEIGFLPPTDPRVRSTVEQIRAELTRNGLVYRYRGADGLPGEEASFNLCSFWLAEALALEGELAESHDLFERVAGAANDVGLLSEEIDPDTGRFLGNFPQGFTHLALIRAAVNLTKVAKHGVEERPETEAERAHRARGGLG